MYQFYAVIIFLLSIICYLLYKDYKKKRVLKYPRFVDPMVRNIINVIYNPKNAIKLWALEQPYKYKWIDVSRGIMKLELPRKIGPGHILLYRIKNNSPLIIKLLVRNVKHNYGHTLARVELLGVSYVDNQA